MGNISLTEWSNSPSHSNKFHLVTRMFDFGSSGSDNVISKISMTVNAQYSTDYYSQINIEYRETAGDTVYEDLVSLPVLGGQNRIISTNITPFPVKQIQLKITYEIGSSISTGGFYYPSATSWYNPIEISDISLWFRTKRDYGTTSGDKISD